jgi:serine/threonine protein kinase
MFHSRLIDFGPIRQTSTQSLHPDSYPLHTIPIGTQGYTPREQLAGNSCFSSDVYAVGMIGIQALTGFHPRQLGKDLRTREVLWCDQAIQVSPALADVLSNMVRYDFQNRYPTATEALNALQQVELEVTSISPRKFSYLEFTALPLSTQGLGNQPLYAAQNGEVGISGFRWQDS